MSAEAGSSKAASKFSPTFDSYNADIQAAALGATKLAAALPADIGFHRSLDSDFAQAIESCSERALKLTNRLLELSVMNSAKESRSKGKRKLEDQEDVLDSYQSLVGDVLDQLFEHADMSLDEFLGRTKPAAIPVKPVLQPSTSNFSAKQGRLDPALMHAMHLSKPQLKFRRKVDNANDSKWTATLKHKYNAQVPLGYVFHDAVNEGENYGSVLKKPHPYLYEIEHISYPRRMFEHEEAISPKSFEETPFTWVDTKGSLDSMLDKLRHAREIAVDLEHHSYRSFSGFLCLMQISTREEDFIVDTLSLREELEDLNEVFTDPNVVKVFHGAESDIVWLQQDLNIYIVNLFDTYHASKLLDFPKHGLAALLEMYCDFIPDKRYQLADWRIRPLPEEMLKYARSDTHFLLYIYDSLRNALLDRAGGQPDLVRSTLVRSQETALRTYEREVYDIATGSGPGGWDTLATKWGRGLSGTRRAVFRAVHSWRDALARAEDESTRYVLPNHHLFQLAERPPADMNALLGVFRSVPPLVRAKAASLLDTIRAAVNEQTAQNRDEDLNAKNDVASQVPSGNPAQSAEKMNSVLVLSEKTSANVKKLLPDLWTSRATINATSSTLLGSQQTVKSKTQTESYSSARSSLFPTGWSTAPAYVRKTVPSTRYSDVVARIHGALIAAPSVPKGMGIHAIVKEVDTSVQSSGIAQSLEVPEPEQIEIPFVPAVQRQPHVAVTAEIADSIVVVGQARQKKRKRSKQQADVDAGGEEGGEDDRSDSKKSKGKLRSTADVDEESETPELEPFDYASAPNFLDGPVKDSSSVLRPGKTKAKNLKGRAFEYGNFPAPPRAFNEVKGASKSHTFRR